MNKFYLLLTLVTIACNTAFSQVPVPELLYYKFDETGTTVTNYASNPPSGTATATIMGSVTQGGAGQCGGALIGSGNASSTDYLNTNWATSLSSTSWTISMWTSNITSSSTLFYVFGDANAGSFRCFTNGVAGPNNWILRGTGITDTYVNGAATTAPSLTTFVYDINTNTIYGYWNGNLVTTVAQPGPSITGTGPFKVMGYATNVGSPAGGLVDEFRVYSRALSAAEVMQLYVRQTTSSFSVTSCGNYTAPSGAVYSATGIYNDTIPNMYCGDSVMTINLTVNQPTASSFTAVSCGSYTAPSGAVFTSTGIYNDTIPNAAGCDSVMTIDLTINQPSASTINPVSCGNYTSPGGAVYMTSGTYMDTIPNAIGCDSVITINLTVNQPSSSSISVSSCGDYTSPGGTVYTNSGIYMDTIPNMAGCDSVITIDLTVGQSSSSTISPIACGVYNSPGGAVYTTSGTYMDTIPNMSGCDSIITINLTVNNVTVSISLNGNSQLEATPGGDTYQWLDCSTGGTPIAGETNQVLGTTATGTYAVEMTVNGCTGTSSCVPYGLGVTELMSSGYKVYPNPASSAIVIESSVNEATRYSVYNQAGQLVLRTNSNEAVVVIDLSKLAPGVYQLKAETADRTEMIRLVKQ